MVERILVPVDGSSFAEQALAPAAALAKATGAQLRLILVHEQRRLAERAVVIGSELIDAQRRESEEQYMEALVPRLSREQGVAAEPVLLSGPAAATISDYATGSGIDLIVMSTHGRGGLSRFWLGSVADALIRHTRVPALLVRPAEEGATAGPLTLRRALAAVDGSEMSETALRTAAGLCRSAGAACTVIRVVVPPDRVIAGRLPDTAALVHERTEQEERDAEEYLTGLVARTDVPDDTRVEVVTGYGAAASILATAQSEQADIIAVGTRGHGGAARLLLGSVADKVIRTSSVPVLVCPPWRPD